MSLLLRCSVYLYYETEGCSVYLYYETEEFINNNLILDNYSKNIPKKSLKLQSGENLSIYKVYVNWASVIRILLTKLQNFFN